MNQKILTAMYWLVTNIAPILLLAGMAIITIASFRISTTIGLYTLGGLIVLVATVLLLPDERG
jgi:hypothetical protein